MPSNRTNSNRTEPRTCEGRACPVCGGVFYPAVRRIAAGGGNFCSVACYAQNRRQTFAARFWEKVDRSGGPDACWPWQAYRDRRGYGEVGDPKQPGRTVKAHRVAWELAAGPIPDGMAVCHTCDNPGCVRNDDAGIYIVNGVAYPRRGHLWLGMSADNSADMVAKGRARNGPVYGDQHWSKRHPERIRNGQAINTCKLTPEQVVAIRERYAAGGVTLAALSAEYGTGQSGLSALIRRQNWRHIP